MRFAVLAMTLLAVRPAGAAVPVVVTDIAPVQSLVAMVMGDLGQPKLLLGNGADPHVFQMRPSQARQLADADLIVWMGPALTPWLPDVLGQLGRNTPARALLQDTELPVRIMNGIAKFLPGRPPFSRPPAPRPLTTPLPGATHTDATGTDPHAWLDPANAAAFLWVIANDLAALDPGHAADYMAHAATAVKMLRRLDAVVRAEVAAAGKVTLVPYHDAFRYFLVRYGLQPFASVTGTDASRPGAARLAKLRTELRAAPAGCIFVEPGGPTGLIESIDPTGRFRMMELDPLGATLTPRPRLYPALIRRIARTVADCAAEP